MINNYLAEIWLIIGLICIIVEFLAIPNIGFLFFGFGALSNALIIYNYSLVGLTNQITLFGLLSLIWFCILYYPLKKYVYCKTTAHKNYSDMVGKEAEVYSKTISPNNLGQVKWSGVIMNAYLASNEHIVNSVGFAYKEQGAKPITNRRATSNVVDESKSIDYTAKAGDQVFIIEVKGNILICSKHRPKE